MRPMRWGDGTRWIVPNARWNFMLELGGDGYVIPPPAPENLSESKPKRKLKSLSSNETPRNSKLLLALARNIKSGQSANEVAVGLHHHLAVDGLTFNAFHKTFRTFRAGRFTCVLVEGDGDALLATGA